MAFYPVLMRNFEVKSLAERSSGSAVHWWRRRYCEMLTFRNVNEVLGHQEEAVEFLGSQWIGFVYDWSRQNVAGTCWVDKSTWAEEDLGLVVVPDDPQSLQLRLRGGSFWSARAQWRSDSSSLQQKLGLSQRSCCFGLSITSACSSGPRVQSDAWATCRFKAIFTVEDYDCSCFGCHRPWFVSGLDCSRGGGTNCGGGCECKQTSGKINRPTAEKC